MVCVDDHPPRLQAGLTSSPMPSNFNLVETFTVIGGLSRIARILESIAKTEQRRLKLELMTRGLSVSALDEAEFVEQKEQKEQKPKTQSEARAAAAQPLVIKQSGEELRELAGLSRTSPEFKAAVGRQLQKVRAAKGQPMDPEFEELLRALDLVDDQVGNGPLSGGAGTLESPLSSQE